MLAAQVVLLDLDRTLIDLQSFTDYDAALADVQDLLGKHDEAEVPETDWDKATTACMSVLHSFLGEPRWHEISRTIAVHERAAIPRSHVMPTVADYREIFASIPTAVVTLLPADVAIAVLDYHDFAVGREVDVVVGRDPLIRPKPQPDGVLEACRLLGSDPGKAVMIGDSTWDARAALAAGASFIGVPPEGFVRGLSDRETQNISMLDSMADALAFMQLGA